jgi:hypothetical protein
MNTLINYPVPSWIAIAFLSVIFIPTFMLAVLAKKGLYNSNKVFYVVLLFFGLYFSYVTVACLNGLFNKPFLPPLVLLCCTFPLALFLFTVIINLKIFKEFLENIKLENLVSIHIFRLVGVFFLLLAFHNSLPKFFAIIAGLGDIITAITSIFVAKAIIQNKAYAKNLTLIWNTFGFLDIAFTAVTAILLTKLSIDKGIMGVDTLAQFPYCFIPAFAPPIIIFLHVAIFSKIKKTFL